MLKNRKLLINTLLLTAVSLLMRSIGLVFQVYVSKKIGASGIGLYYLIMSVSMFASTVAISGIRFTTTRLVSEELGQNNFGGVRKAVRKALFYAVVCGTLASLLLWFSSDFICLSIIKDERTVLSLHILSISLPFLAMGAVITGYFIAVMKVSLSAIDQFAEQLIRMAVIVFALSFADVSNVKESCACLVLGGVAGEFFGFFVIYGLYKWDIRKIKKINSSCGEHITKRMFKIAVPLALTAYARTALSSIQNLLVPRGIRKYGASPETALASYGMIQGMVFPVITFPSALFSSISELIVPELTGAQVRGESEIIKNKIRKILYVCIKFSLCVMGVFLCFSLDFGQVIYGDDSISGYIVRLAPLMPIMYLDTVTDGMLRGLGQHMQSMKYNIIDSLISTVLVYILIPKYSVSGYIFILYFSEIFNFILSFLRLYRVTGAGFRIKELSVPAVSLVLSILSSNTILKAIIPGKTGVPELIYKVLFLIGMYVLFLKIFSNFGKAKRQKKNRCKINICADDS